MEYDPDFIDENKEYGLRVEYVNGLGIWELAPSWHHQRAITRIRNSLRVADGASCACIHESDVNVKFGDRVFKRPDIAVWCREPELVGRSIATIPDAVVEVVSPRFEAKDLTYLPGLYLAAGVRDVLVYDEQRRCVQHSDCHVTTEYETPHTFLLHCGCEVTV